MEQQVGDGRASRVESLAVRSAELAARAGRPDLERRARQAARRVGRAAAVVVVAGDHGAGKSSLINAIAGVEICPVDALDATTALTVVRAGPGSATIRLAADPPGDIRPLQPGELAEWVTEFGNPRNHRGVEIADVTVESSTLADGLVLVDTPGTGGLNPGLVRALTDLIPSADGILLALDAGAPITTDAVAMLVDAAANDVDVLVALTKIDLHPEWRTVAAATAQRLRDGGLRPTVVPTAVSLVPESDSGIAGLVIELGRRVGGRSEARAADTALAVAGAVAETLAEGSDEAEQQARRAALSEGIRRWPALLQEGFAEVTVELDGEVRAGIVRLGSSSDEDIGSIDPGKDWARLRSNVDDRVAALVKLLSERLTAATESVSESIATALGVPGSLDIEAVSVDVAAPGVEAEAPETQASAGAVSRSLDILRGSYGGIVLAGVLGQIVALPIAAPLALGAGAVFGARQLGDQRKRRVEQRRTAARRVIRAHLDETGARLGAAVRKAVQAAQRDLRDATEVLIAELQASDAAGADVSAEAADLLASVRTEERRR